MNLTVVTVSWNSKKDFQNGLPSLLSQIDSGSEVIVVDNNSQDTTVQWLQENYPQVETICLDSNQGFSAGCNVGVKKARGKYVCLLNPDTQVRPGVLKTMMDWMEKHPQVGACGPKLLNPDGSLQYSTRTLPSLWTEFCQEFRLSALFPTSRLFSGYYLNHWPHDKPRNVGAVVGAALMIRRECFDQIGFFDDQNFFMYYEELDFCLRLQKEGYQVSFLPTAQVEHLGGSSTRGIEKQARCYLLDSRFNFHKKHSGFASVLGLWLIEVLSLIFWIPLLSLFYYLGIKGEKALQLRKTYQITFSYLSARLRGKIFKP